MLHALLVVNAGGACGHTVLLGMQQPLMNKQQALFLLKSLANNANFTKISLVAAPLDPALCVKKRKKLPPLAPRPPVRFDRYLSAKEAFCVGLLGRPVRGVASREQICEDS